MGKQITYTINGKITCVNFKIRLIDENGKTHHADLCIFFPRLKRFIVEIVSDEIKRMPFNSETGELLDGDSYKIAPEELKRINDKLRFIKI